MAEGLAGSLEMIIRPERPADLPAIRAVNLAAFAPREMEADLVDNLRANENVIASLVCEQEERIAGHILFSPAVIRMDSGAEVGIAALGPVAVLPERQRSGIGSALIEAGLAELQAAGHTVCILVGHPEYYPRFGFEPASKFGLRSQWELPDPVFMALPLKPGALDGISGTAYYTPEFEEA